LTSAETVGRAERASVIYGNHHHFPQEGAIMGAEVIIYGKDT
jgi:hypothetical protein